MPTEKRSQDKLQDTEQKVDEVVRISSSSAVGAAIGSGSGLIAAGTVMGGIGGSILPGVGTSYRCNCRRSYQLCCWQEFST